MLDVNIYFLCSGKICEVCVLLGDGFCKACMFQLKLKCSSVDICFCGVEYLTLVQWCIGEPQ